jgi:hypothetical protein
MRFSLKWLLIGTGYAAVAAAALTQDSWVWADIVSVLSLVALAFAVVVSFVARGPRQATALGFVAFSASYLVWLQFAESSVPTSRLLLAVRFRGDMPPEPPRLTIRGNPPPPGSMTPEAKVRMQMLQVQTEMLRLRNEQLEVIARQNSSIDLITYLRAGHAVATMAFGLLGCLLGPLAFKAAKPKAGEHPT